MAPDESGTNTEAQSNVALPQIRRVRVCLLGGTADGCSFQPGLGKLDVASALLRGLTWDRPSASDAILDLAYDHGVFERAWWDLLALKEVNEDSPVIDRWGIGPLSAWDVEGRLRYDRPAPGEATPAYDVDPMEESISLCAGNPSKLHFGNPRSQGVTRQFRDTLTVAGHDLSALESVQQELEKLAKEKPREIVRKDAPCPTILASFARYSPEVGDFEGCGTVFLHLFEKENRPLSNENNVGMLYAAAPRSWTHRGHPPGAFLLALSAIGANVSRIMREYNRLVSKQPPEAWERALWWQADIRSQVEYYFCDKNLRIERYFRERIVGQDEGWIDIEWVKTFPRLAHCEISMREELVDALRDSICVETKVTEEGNSFVRRYGGNPLPDLGEPRKRRYGGGEVPWNKRRSSNSDDPTCWDFVRRGVCPRGDRCKYVHANPNGEAAATAGAETPVAGSTAAQGAPAEGAPSEEVSDVAAAQAEAASQMVAAAAAAAVAASAAATPAAVPEPAAFEAGVAPAETGLMEAARALSDQIREAGLLPSSTEGGDAQ